MSSCHDKETQWYTSQCKISTKQNVYFTQYQFDASKII